MKTMYHRNIALFICIKLILIISFDCNAQHKPWTLGGCLRYMDKVMDDTTKYDFKVSPYNYCYFKHEFGASFRNSMGLWSKFNPLSLYFRIRGIRHPDDMSSIIQCSYYRYLNDHRINFREQKKKYKTYWKEIGKGRNYEDVSYELWGQYNLPDSIAQAKYMDLFYPGIKVKGYITIVGDIKEWENGNTSSRHEQVYYIAEVTKVYNKELEISVIKVGQIEEGFEVSDQYFDENPKIGEKVMVDACSVYLVPDLK